MTTLAERRKQPQQQPRCPRDDFDKNDSDPVGSTTKAAATSAGRTDASLLQSSASASSSSSASCSPSSFKSLVHFITGILVGITACQLNGSNNAASQHLTATTATSKMASLAAAGSTGSIEASFTPWHLYDLETACRNFRPPKSDGDRSGDSGDGGDDDDDEETNATGGGLEGKNRNQDKKADIEKIVVDRDLLEQEALEELEDEEKKSDSENGIDIAATTKTAFSSFPESMQDLFVGMSLVSRNEFIQQFDLGYGWDPTAHYNQHVVVLHGAGTLPRSTKTSTRKSKSNNNSDNNKNITTTRTRLSVQHVLQSCQTVKMVLTEPVTRDTGKAKIRSQQGQRKYECLAIVPQWESFHVHKLTREPPQQPAVDMTSDTDTTEDTTNKKVKGKRIQLRNIAALPLDDNDQQQSQPWHYVAGRTAGQPLPTVEQSQAAQAALLTYLTHYDAALERLKPLAEAASRGSGGGSSDDKSRRGPVIVMVSNFGQASFFMNFICHAQARNLDISRVLLFASDLETYQLATRMGILVYYHPEIFATIPSDAARTYHDPKYGLIMMSKVYCVQMVNALGYDVLFQDVDIAWYKNPLDYFEKDLPAHGRHFDMYFQHDGFHHPDKFAPLAANTGFYYVRNNAKTRHFFHVLVRMGDLVLAAHSHQGAMTTLLNEHASLRGLQVKVLAASHELFPTGFHYRIDSPVVQRMRANLPVDAYIFHVNWMKMRLKRPVLRQTNNWYTKNQCFDLNQLLLNQTFSTMPEFQEMCCTSEAVGPPVKKAKKTSKANHTP